MQQGFFPSSLSALSLSSGTTSLQQSLYALVLSQVIVAHPAILATPASTVITGGLNSRITYPVSLTIAALVGCFLWGVGLPDKVDYATAGLMTIGEPSLAPRLPSFLFTRRDLEFDDCDVKDKGTGHELIQLVSLAFLNSRPLASRPIAKLDLVSLGIVFFGHLAHHLAYEPNV
jgi:hypothetical protein